MEKLLPGHELKAQCVLPMGKFCFSTDALPEADRFNALRETMLMKCGVDLDPHLDMPLTARIEKLPVGHSAVLKMASSRIRYFPLEETRTQGEYLIFMTMRKGCAYGRQRGREVRIGPGQATAFLSSEHYIIEMMEKSGAFSTFWTPVSIAASVVPNLSAALIQPLEDSQHAITLLNSYITNLMNLNAPMNPELTKTATDHMAELASFALNSLSGAAKMGDGSGIRAARRIEIKQWIAANLGRQDLSCDEVASQLGITGRYLRQLLKDEGTSFSTYLRRMRLQRAYEMLSDPQYLQRPIGFVSRGTGFKNLSYFIYCFRQEFGLTPSEIRDITIQKLTGAA